MASGLTVVEELEVGLRLRRWRESLGVASREALAAQLDLPPGTYPSGTYKNHETGKSLPNAAHLRRLAELGCDVGWLVTGRSSQAQTQIGGALKPAYDATIGVDGKPIFVEVKSYRQPLSAGRGMPEMDEPDIGAVRLERHFLEQLVRRDPDVLLWAYAEGASMSPTIQDGEALLIDTSDQFLTNDKIYGLSVDQSLLLKRIRRSVSSKVRLISDNKDYEDEDIIANTDLDFRVLGRVIWHAGLI